MLAEVKVVLIGAGGLGSIIAEGLARLGIHNICIIDPDKAEMSNINRVIGMAYADAVVGMRKADIACRQVAAINPSAHATAVCDSVFEPKCLDPLKSCDLIIVATDNHATRMYAQRISTQYLIPLVSVGFNIEVDEEGDGKILDVSGEYAVALPGANGWCLACAHAYDPEIAAWELCGRS